MNEKLLSAAPVDVARPAEKSVFFDGCDASRIDWDIPFMKIGGGVVDRHALQRC